MELEDIAEECFSKLKMTLTELIEIVDSECNGWGFKLEDDFSISLIYFYFDKAELCQSSIYGIPLSEMNFIIQNYNQRISHDIMRFLKASMAAEKYL